MNARLHSTLALSLLPMAPPSSMVHQIMSEDRAVRADLDYLRLLKSGELDRRNWDAATRAEMQLRGVTGETL